MAVAKLAGRRSRNVRISCTFMPYHHKAPQHEHAQLASRIVVAPAHDTARGSARGQRRATDCSATRRSADGRGRGTHARCSPARLASCPYISSQYCLLQILSIKLLYNTGSSTGRSTYLSDFYVVSIQTFCAVPESSRSVTLKYLPFHASTSRFAL